MIYKGKDDKISRHLRRLWEVKVYVGNPDAKKPKIKKETMIAWNHTDAIRRAPGQVAEQPVSIGWVTWPDGKGETYIIESPQAGPTTKKAKPSIETPDEEDWDF